MTLKQNEQGQWVYEGDTFQIVLHRYSDPHRLNLARNAAIYLGKKDRDNIRRPLSIIRQGHVPEIFRGEQVEFEFIDVSKEVYDHLITYTTRNMRATGGNRALASNDFTMPSDKMKHDELVNSMVERSMNAYECLLASGETKQVARSAMPVAAKMNPFVYQFNFLTLGESLFKQRIWEKGAQGNTVKVVKGMFDLCMNIDPDLWHTFYEYKGAPAIEWEEVRKKLKKKNYTIDDLVNDLISDGVLSNNTTEHSVYDENVVDYLTKKFGEQKSMW